MYNNLAEAIAIYHGIIPANIYTIHEAVSGQRITGTAQELYAAIREADKATGGNISHTPADYIPGKSCGNVETWAIIETAYAL